MQIYFFLFTFIFSFFNPNQNPIVNEGFAQNSNFTSIIKWQNEVDFDFGEAKKGAVLKHTFIFKNTDNQPITIETARTTCGCTAAEWTLTPIAPNENGEIIVEYDSNKTGDFRKKIKVFFHQQKKGENLWVNGTVL
jgi:hypothetical protein